MKIEPVRYNRLIMQLMAPTPRNAVRQARSASPSSERRTPGAATINSLPEECTPPDARGKRRLILPIFVGSVYCGPVNLNDARSPKPGFLPQPTTGFRRFRLA